MNAIQWLLLIIITLFFIYISWRVSIKAKRYHGFYRFFSFECILVIVVLNYPFWFVDVFSLPQICSWILLTGSILLAILGFASLFNQGKPVGQWEDTSQLVTTGIYKYLRHPMYVSLVCGGFGAMLKDPGILQITLSLVNLLALYLTTRVEEQEMIDKFGEEYQKYIERSYLIIPYIL